MGPFEVTKEMMSRLNDEQLRKLLSHLLEAEARVRGIPPSAISVGGNQTAGDGGVDASIAWFGAPGPADWLPRQTIYFQCKAEVMSRADLIKEMRPDGVVRTIFAELAQVGGSYIVFSTDDPSQSAYGRRRTAMREAIVGVAGEEQILLDFYGADRIARWVNQHLGVALWVLEQRGRALGGWRPYGNWSAASMRGGLYLFYDAARAVLDGVEVDVYSAIIAIRRVLHTPGGKVRLIGISGMGKTRIAEALFDDRIDPQTALAPSRAVYGDIGLDLSTGAALLAEQVVLSGSEAVIVVDNCNVRTHGQLAEIVSRQGSRSSLLTIDYDVGGDKPSGTRLMFGLQTRQRHHVIPACSVACWKGRARVTEAGSTDDWTMPSTIATFRIIW